LIYIVLNVKQIGQETWVVWAEIYLLP
jgi:hypothetical protein